MKFVEEDTYVCPTCGCMFKREELGSEAPAFAKAIVERDNVHCIACGRLGADYMAKDLKILFRSERE